jgi:hypothetical protein
MCVQLLDNMKEVAGLYLNLYFIRSAGRKTRLQP